MLLDPLAQLSLQLGDGEPHHDVEAVIQGACIQYGGHHSVLPGRDIPVCNRTAYICSS